MSKTESRWQVPLADVVLGSEEIEAVTQVLKSGWLSMGPKTEEFEQRFAQFLGSKTCLRGGQRHRRPPPGL